MQVQCQPTPGLLLIIAFDALHELAAMLSIVVVVAVMHHLARPPILPDAIAIASVSFPPELLRSCGTCGQTPCTTSQNHKKNRTATRRVGSVEDPAQAIRHDKGKSGRLACHGSPFF
jgi:hypothetical protein